jgi:hypothetical protein
LPFPSSPHWAPRDNDNVFRTEHGTPEQWRLAGTKRPRWLRGALVEIIGGQVDVKRPGLSRRLWPDSRARA